MVSKNQIKLIKSLGQKKHRQQQGLFVVEGIKCITEFLSSNLELYNLYTTDLIFDAPEAFVTKISTAELLKISSLKAPNTALAVFKIPDTKTPETNGLIVALDAIRDPGNLGTIIRLCDWYGITQIVCSKNTVDCYNPKVVQASMGSSTRVAVNYLNLNEFLNSVNTTIFGTFMHGENIYKAKLPNQGIIVLGNEANGISETTQAFIERKITIPQFGKTQNTESLNVANATAIVLSEFKRRFT